MEYTKELARSLVEPRYPSQLHNILKYIIEEADVPDSVKRQWELNRLSRLAHHNPKLLPYYLRVSRDERKIREFFNRVEAERMKSENE